MFLGKARVMKTVNSAIYNDNLLKEMNKETIKIISQIDIFKTETLQRLKYMTMTVTI